MYQRTVEGRVIETLDTHNIAILYGARQVGKTTLAMAITN